MTELQFLGGNWKNCQDLAGCTTVFQVGHLVHKLYMIVICHGAPLLILYSYEFVKDWAVEVFLIYNVIMYSCGKSLVRIVGSRSYYSSLLHKYGISESELPKLVPLNIQKHKHRCLYPSLFGASEFWCRTARVIGTSWRVHHHWASVWDFWKHTCRCNAHKRNDRHGTLSSCQSKQDYLKGQSGFRPNPTEPVWFFVNSTPHLSTSAGLAGHGVVWNQTDRPAGHCSLLLHNIWRQAPAATLPLLCPLAPPLQLQGCLLAVSCSSGNEDHHHCNQWQEKEDVHHLLHLMCKR
jgi:hypothetical protein